MKEFRKKLARKIRGRFSIGNLTIYGDTAMDFGVTFWTKRFGYICFRLPMPCGIADKLQFGKGYKLRWHPLYLYISRNATPWAAVFMLGRKHSPKDWALARVRKHVFGWKYNAKDDFQYERLRQINNMLSFIN